MLTRLEIHDGRRAMGFDAWPAWAFQASEWTGFARRDTDDAVIYTLDVPGYRKNDLSVEVEARRVTVRGEQNEGLLKPRLRRSFVRSFTLPDSLDSSDVQAELQNGVLSLTIAKQPAARARRIPVHVEGKPAGASAKAPTSETLPRPSLWQRLRAKLHTS